jgi:hypothetical protein
MTPEKRLELIVRVVNLLRDEIERNGNRYDGRMVPNLTSVTDLATLSERFLANVEESIVLLERERGVVPTVFLLRTKGSQNG